MNDTEKNIYQSELLKNRLSKRYKHLKKWAKRNNVFCFRLYDKDIPEIPLVIDLYTDENDIDKVKDLTHLFNLNQAKKNVLRVLKLNSLLDKVSDQMIERFTKQPGAFSNSDLLNYMQVTQSAIDRANKALNLVDETPAIQINQQV